MTVTDMGEARLAELERWLSSLPAGVASWHREEVERDPGGIHFSIKPVRRPSAATIRLRIDRETGFVYLGAGEAYRLDDINWPDMPLGRICQAIVSGGLTEEVRLWKGKETGRKACLQVEGEDTPVCTNQIYSLTGELRRALSGNKQKRTIRYAPY
jgi:hypothetical protein